MLVLTQEQFNLLQVEHNSVETALKLYSNDLLKSQKKFPLDYNLIVPPIQVPRRFTYIGYHEMLERRTFFKNLVFRRILEIREIKSKPKLHEFLSIFRKNSKAKDQLLKKLEVLYSAQNQKKNWIDIKYERLKNSFDRIVKVSMVHSEGLDAAEKKISKLLRRRLTRENLRANIS